MVFVPNNIKIELVVVEKTELVLTRQFLIAKVLFLKFYHLLASVSVRKLDEFIHLSRCKFCIVSTSITPH